MINFRYQRDDGKDLKLRLLQRENHYLVEALQDIVDSPIEYVESAETLHGLRLLLEGAAESQDAIDYIDKQVQAQRQYGEQ